MPTQCPEQGEAALQAQTPGLAREAEGAAPLPSHSSCSGDGMETLARSFLAEL